MAFRCQYQETPVQVPVQYQYIKHLPLNFEFYLVQDDYTANNFGQQESRDGYSAQGEYFVNLPDGRLQKVRPSDMKVSGP